MKRKLNKVGIDTLTISLPKEWADRNSLKKGDEVEIDVKGGSLTVFGKGPKEDKIVEIDASENPSTTYRLLRCNYMMGADEVKINFKNKKFVEIIEREMPNFVGFEIIDKAPNYWILRRIADIMEGEFYNVLKKMFGLVHLMGSDIYNGLEGRGKLSKAENIESTINRLFIFCTRHIYNSGWMLKTPTPYYVIVQKLENIADHFSFISNQYPQNKIAKASRQTLKFVSGCLEFIKSFENYYYNFTIEGIGDLLDRKENLVSTGSKLYKSIPRNDMIIIGEMIDIVVLAWDGISATFDIKTAENPQTVGIFEKN